MFKILKSNMTADDRLFRVLFAIFIGGLYFSQFLIGIPAVLLMLLAAALLFTGISGFCPFYLPFERSSENTTQE